MVKLRAASRPLGAVLLSYLIEPFLVNWDNLSPTDPMQWHSNAWENRRIAQTFLDLGYEVHAISTWNTTYKPQIGRAHV